jgi:hypothetical protein
MGVRQGSKWRAVRERVIREEDICHICREPVDKSLPYKDPRTGLINGRSKSVHHLDPHPTPETVAIRSRLRLAHLSCNSSQGDGSRVKSKTSTRW